MLLTAFGMEGAIRFPRSRGVPVARTSGTETADDRPGAAGPDRLHQGPVEEADAPLDAAAQEDGARTVITGWIDLTSLPGRPPARPGDGLAAIQRLLDERGAAAVRSLRGDFVIAHLSPDATSLRLYRAVNALIPVFWQHREGSFRWAVDPRRLLDGPPRLSDVDTDVLPMVIAERGMPHDRSWFSGVHRVPTGHCVTVAGPAAPRVERFDEFRPATDVPRTIDEAAEGMRARVSAACARMLSGQRSSVVMLSGGIDSAAVAYEAGLLADTVGLHYTLEGFPGFADDRDSAEAVARACGLTWMPRDMSKHTTPGGDYIRPAQGGALPQTHVPLQGVTAAVEQAEANGARFVLSGLLADQAFAHDLNRGLFEVGGLALLDPRVAGEPIWQTLASAAASTFSGNGKGPGFLGTARHLFRVASGDPTTALPDRDTIVHPIGFTDAAGDRVTQAIRHAADRARGSLHGTMRRDGGSRRSLPQGITSLFMLGESFNTTNLQAAWLNHCLPKRRFFSTPFADRDLIEYALSLPARHRLGFGHGMIVDKFALRLAYAERGAPTARGHRMQQARIDSIPALYVNQNFETVTSLLNRDALLVELGVLSVGFVDSLSRGRLHRNGEELARLCVIEQWLEGLC